MVTFSLRRLYLSKQLCHPALYSFCFTLLILVRSLFWKWMKLGLTGAMTRFQFLIIQFFLVFIQNLNSNVWNARTYSQTAASNYILFVYVRQTLSPVSIIKNNSFRNCDGIYRFYYLFFHHAIVFFTLHCALCHVFGDTRKTARKLIRAVKS